MRRRRDTADHHLQAQELEQVIISEELRGKSVEYQQVIRGISEEGLRGKSVGSVEGPHRHTPWAFTIAASLRGRAGGGGPFKIA